jgi:1-deoxy-D-xylulose 5-phosphate reductoisomerase
LKKIIILGSTGSIGTQALDVIRAGKGRFKVVALAAHSNVKALKGQIAEFKPRAAAIWDKDAAEELKAWCASKGYRTAILHGLEGLVDIARSCPADLVISSVVGAVGIEPLLAAIRSGKDVALANKEALVAAGSLVMEEAARNKVRIIPVDSEHSAIFQCMSGESRGGVRRILLTASGGPFYRSKQRFASVSVKQALDHPTWVMGKKITIDSATLVNKGLEAIEAHHLFGLPMDAIEIVIHPQSIVHSMVEYVDGTVIAQLSRPDMRLPIQYAMTWPDRCASPVERLDLTKVGRLEFSRPDFKRFPCLALALSAGKTGGTMPAVMNAANETAVHAFLAGDIKLDAVAKVIRKVMDEHRPARKPGLAAILAADTAARARAREIVQRG